MSKLELKQTFRPGDDTEYCKSFAEVSRKTGIKYHRVLKIKNVLIIIIARNNIIITISSTTIIKTAINASIIFFILIIKITSCAC